MPNPRNEGHRLRAGTFTSSGITSTYEIRSWAVQSDQIVGNQTIYPWTAPNQPLPPDFSRIAGNLNQTTRNDGGLGWTWIFSYWTFGQMAYFLGQFFSSGLYVGARSAAVSVMTYDLADTAFYLNAQLALPKIGQDFFEAEQGGYKDIHLTFYAGVITS